MFLLIFPLTCMPTGHAMDKNTVCMPWQCDLSVDVSLWCQSLSVCRDCVVFLLTSVSDVSLWTFSKNWYQNAVDIVLNYTNCIENWSFIKNLEPSPTVLLAMIDAAKCAISLPPDYKDVNRKLLLLAHTVICSYCTLCMSLGIVHGHCSWQWNMQCLSMCTLWMTVNVFN